LSITIPIRGTRTERTGRRAFTTEMLSLIERVPGTIAASWGESTPLTGGSGSVSFSRSDRPLPKPFDRGNSIGIGAVGPGYFAASGPPLIRGRAFTLQDYDHPQTVAILNEAAARTYFPGEDAIGHQVDGVGGRPWKTVVGIVADSKNRGLNQPPAPQLFL